MKESAVFVNIGRGDLIKDEVLIEALDAGELSHAILDVFDPEPLGKGHPFFGGWRMLQSHRIFQVKAENIYQGPLPYSKKYA